MQDTQRLMNAVARPITPGGIQKLQHLDGVIVKEVVEKKQEK